ncbi:unnamed protein product [Effrenium voratum]|uniref:Ubiquitin-like domain-containing protein n=1 Tax=Effrenium voratum TaxID=2562239 RepID=A0AA36MZ48_9DINO|nr:unnamed protein product [Effrenium voratum]
MKRAAEDVASPKVRKLEVVTVEVRAVSGNCLGMFEMSPSSTIADVKAKLEEVPGRFHLVSEGSEALPEHTQLLTFEGARLALTLVWRRKGFAYAAHVDGSLTLWDLDSREAIHRLRCSLCQPQCPIALFVDWEKRRLLCCLEDGTLYLWGNAEATFDDSLHLLRVSKDTEMDRSGVSSKEALAVCWSEDLVLVGMMSGCLLLWNVQSGKKMKTFRGHRSCVDVVRVCWESQMALSAGRDRLIRLWKMETGECCVLRGHTSSVQCLLVNWERRQAITAGLMDGLRFWSLYSRQAVQVCTHACPEGQKLICSDVDWASERAITASGSGILTVWDVSLFKVVWSHGRHGGDVTSVSFEPGARRCLSAGSAAVCLWDAAGNSLCRIHQGGCELGCLVLDWASGWLLSGSDTVRLYAWQPERYGALVQADLLCELRNREMQSPTICLAVEWREAVSV